MITESISSPPVIDGGRPQQLHPAICKVWKWGAVFTWSLVGLGSIPISLLFTTRKFGGHTWIVVIGPILAFGFAALSWWIADRQFRAWSYQLSERELVLSHGLLFRTRRTVPRGRVQHIDINSGPLDRKFGLVQVCIYVAGAMGSIGAIPGLTPERAEELKAAIIEGRDIHA